MIEAGYSGKLSGVLANFSSNPIKIGFKEEIAKINFFKLNETPCVKKELIKDEDYINGLRKNAENYYKSFLNIKGIEANIETTIYKKVRNLLTTSGVILTVLILFSTIEPLLSRWIFEKTGVISTSEQISIQNSLIETNILLKENINNGKLELQKIQSQIDSIKQSIK